MLNECTLKPSGAVDAKVKESSSQLGDTPIPLFTIHLQSDLLYPQIDLPESATVEASTTETSAAITLPRFIGTPVWKRILDVVGASVLLICLSPLFLVLAIYIKLVSHGPVFFKQSRIGAGGIPFMIYKFRTMHCCAESEANHQKYIAALNAQDAPAEKPSYGKRLIPGAEFLRGHSFDELPQLINVLFGSMSLVGPRPEVLNIEDYQPWQLQRFRVLPGITGLWQVSGKNRLSFHRMIELDNRYIEEQSLANDLSILFRTIRVVVGKDNA